MNFKIDYNFLDITNSPSIENYLEKRAREGWLIDRIIIGSIFLFKKIEKTDLEFSISPYEVETAFTRKKKSEVEEFQEVSEAVGWNYVTKSYDLHLYYKNKNAEAIPIQTDEEEEFKTLDRIVKKRIRAYWFQTFLFTLFTWFTIGGLINGVSFLKDGASQLLLPLLPIVLISSIWGLVHMYHFQKTNRENINKGKEIEYSDSNFIIPKLSFIFGGIIILLILIHYLYIGIVFKDRIILIAALPILIGLTLGNAYRFFVKPSRISIGYKKVGWIVTILAAFIIGSWTGLFNIGNESEKNDGIKIEDYNVLTADDFPDDQFRQEGTLRRNFSLLVPESYEYYYINYNDEFVETEYGRTLTEGIAKNMVERYKKEIKNLYTGRYQPEISSYFEEGIFDDHLLTAGITEDDLIRLKDFEAKEAKEIVSKLIQERSISPTNKDDWNADESYYLSFEKDSLLIRDGKEVYYLEGKDFTNPAVIKNTKEKINLR